jgi:hypothetical protein
MFEFFDIYYYAEEWDCRSNNSSGLTEKVKSSVYFCRVTMYVYMGTKTIVEVHSIVVRVYPNPNPMMEK